ncbi:MAG: hypothetical protein LBN98_01460 [Prevotellaceae bacterium]|nr:hypothetical protein [Prevotellaceae bacterium]
MVNLKNIDMDFITVKDVQKLMRLRPSAAYNRLALVRHALGKKKLPNGRYQPVTFREFCEYYGIDYEIYKNKELKFAEASKAFLK